MWAHELSQDRDLVTLVIGTQDVASAPENLPGRILRVPPALGRSKWKKAIGWNAPDVARVRAAVADLAGAPERVLVFRLGISAAVDGLPVSWLDRAEIDLDDWESERCWSLAGLSMRAGSLWPAVQFAAGSFFYRRLERRALARFPVVHIASPDDAAVLRARFGGTVRATPNRIAGPASPLPDRAPEGRASVLFVGTLAYLPNRDAVFWLMKSIEPRLAAAVPGVTVTVVGDAPRKTGARFKASALDWRGYVDDLREVYEAATIVIAPLRGGSGTKLKILEAWLYGRAVVATSHAVRGLGVVPGRHALVADSADDIVEACRKLIEDGALRKHIAEEGHRLLLSQFLIPAETPSIEGVPADGAAPAPVL